MQTQKLITKKSMKNKGKEIIFSIASNSINNPLMRKLLFSALKKYLHRYLLSYEVKKKHYPKNMQMKKYQFGIAMLDSIERTFQKGNVSLGVAEKTFRTLTQNFLHTQESREIYNDFNKKYGKNPPLFIVLGPTQRCNLKCKGCYASAGYDAPTLSYETIDKITRELHDEWGNRFMTITGGEPLMYNDNGRTMFDLWEKYNDMYFLFYTNGILITKEVAEKLANLGNVLPAISVEGYEKETDARRGVGVYKKILESINNLKEAGVPFCVSITATKENYNLLINDEFYDYVFKELGAIFMWMFQLMPIGQACDMRNCMIEPQQRLALFRKWEEIISKKKYPVADFWNSGLLTDGCIAYGRNGGYLYIDWNGNITPCVFVPFYEDNIIELHKEGKKLTDSLFSQLFINGREWQKSYGYTCPKDAKNWLMPCSIRDNFSNFKKNIITKNTKAEDEHAKEAIESKDYMDTLDKFDKELEGRTLPVWKKEFMGEEKI